MSARPAPPTDLLLSASLIVKDEEANLPSCLRALESVVDEVVVYDTGSRDRTVAVARKLGARVVKGYWDDDFSRARNACLDECRGQWILWVDADEVLECDPIELRSVLLNANQCQVLSLSILNLSGDGTSEGPTHRAFRLFRRDDCHLAGRLHEQVVLRPGKSGTLKVGTLVGGRLVHSGYLDSAITERDKLERNLRLARIDQHQPSDGLAEFNLARALSAAGRREEAVPHFATAIERLDDAPAALRQALIDGTAVLLDTGQPARALEWADRLRRNSTNADLPDFFAGLALHQLDRSDEAFAVMAPLGPDLTNEDGYVAPAGTLEVGRINVLMAVNRPDAAVEEALRLLSLRTDVTTVCLAVSAFTRARRTLWSLVCALPEPRLQEVVATLALLPPSIAHDFATALLERFGHRPQIVAAAVRFAPHLSAELALEWSIELRAVGLGERCPLLARASNPELPLRDRLRAAATTYAAFGDPDAAALVATLSAGMSDDDWDAAAVEVEMLAPSLLNGAEAARAAQTATYAMND